MSHRTEASYFLPLNEILTKVPSLMSSFFVVLQSMNVLNVFLDIMHQKIILKDLKSIYFVHVNVGA